MAINSTFEPVERCCEGNCETCVNEHQHEESTHPVTVETRPPATVFATPAPRAVKKILVAVDHDQHPAIQTALLLATALHAQIAIVFSLEPLVVASESEYVSGENIQERRAMALDLLKAIEKSIPENARAFTCLREGDAPTEIVAAAAEWDADLIVIGTHRRGIVGRMFLGSTSQAVLRHATCPVLFVPEPPAAA